MVLWFWLCHDKLLVTINGCCWHYVGDNFRCSGYRTDLYSINSLFLFIESYSNAWGLHDEKLLKQPDKLFKCLVWVLFGRRCKFQIKFHANLFLEMNIFRVNHRMFWQKSSVVFIANEIMLPELKLPRGKSRLFAINGQWEKWPQMTKTLPCITFL